jgi:DNA-binding NarL/FixJ family response regulator
VADGNSDFLQQIVSLLDRKYEVVSSATDGESALESIYKHRPDVAVLDLKLPGINGLEIVARTSTCVPRPHIVMCCTESDPDFVDAAFQAGILGYVLKKRIATDLVRAVETVARGERFLSA